MQWPEALSFKKRLKLETAINFFRDQLLRKFILRFLALKRICFAGINFVKRKLWAKRK